MITLKERLVIQQEKIQVLGQYIEFCIETEVVPNSVITTLVLNTQSLKALTSTKKEIEKSLKSFREQNKK